MTDRTVPAATDGRADPADLAILRWHDGYLLGYTPMDHVHEEFVELVGRLQTAADEELPALLEAFVTHAKAHFDQEDRWMNETSFPARECHINEHAAVMRSVLAVRERLAQGDHTMCRELAAELAGWFPGHADYLDSALSHWMCKLRLGGKPVVLRRGGLAYPPKQAGAR
jgi:hemerythrin-like metal-binding protein